MPPLPWKLTFQTSPAGRRSRFQIWDAKGKLLAKCHSEPAARLLVLAGEALELLEQTSDTAAVWQVMLSSEFGHQVGEPRNGGCIAAARKLILKSKGLSP